MHGVINLSNPSSMLQFPSAVEAATRMNKVSMWKQSWVFCKAEPESLTFDKSKYTWPLDGFTAIIYRNWQWIPGKSARGERFVIILDLNFNMRVMTCLKDYLGSLFHIIMEKSIWPRHSKGSGLHIHSNTYDNTWN